MKIVLTTLGDDIYTIEVSDDIELENFKALCEIECGIPASEMMLILAGRPLHDDKLSLSSYGVNDGDIIIVQRIQGARGHRQPQQHRQQSSIPIDFGAINIPNQPVSSEDPAVLRDLLLQNPHDLAILKERNPALAEALLSGNLEKFSKVLRKQQSEKKEQQLQRIRMLNADPFDPEAQKLIAEEIRLENVEANMQAAMEFSPESFAQVAMLYIDCIVNGYPVKAFIDSGAQMTIMSQACAERCHIMRLVDTRWAGIAKGVGTQKIIGRIHVCQIQIGNDFLQSSFSVLENQQMDMLLGLDMLKRHQMLYKYKNRHLSVLNDALRATSLQCCIDLKRNVLVIGTTGTQTPFLTEAELPDFARLNRQPSETMAMEDEDSALAEALARSAEEAHSHSSVKSNTPSSSTGRASGFKTPSSSSSSSATPPKQARFPESDIAKLVNYGFNRHQVLEELTRANGNVDQALAALFAKSFVVPK